MSTEINLKELYNNSLINYCDEILNKLGATSFKTFDDEKKE